MPRRASALVPAIAYVPRDRHLASLARLSVIDASRGAKIARLADVAVPTGVAARHAAALGVIPRLTARARRRALGPVAHDSATMRAKSVALTIPTGSRALQTTTRRARRSATCAATRYSFMSAGRQITAASYAASIGVDRG